VRTWVVTKNSVDWWRCSGSR